MHGDKYFLYQKDYTMPLGQSSHVVFWYNFGMVSEVTVSTVITP